MSITRISARPALLGFVALLGVLASLTGCSSSPSGQESFSTPHKGAAELVDALRAHNNTRLREILGPESDALLSSGDPIAEQETYDTFVSLYDQWHVLGLQEDGSATLIVGDNNWPMPIPLVPAGGSWHFDTARGKDEILSRRIGRNELSAIEVCRAIADAQQEYASQGAGGTPGEYAARIISEPGKRNGLYWEAGPNESPSPLGPLVGRAQAEGYRAGDSPRPYHGYMYRILSAQGPWAPDGAMSYVANDHMTGGFAILAYPATYGNSGIMTFMTSRSGVVYQRDLGPGTESAAKATTTFDPDSTWSVVK